LRWSETLERCSESRDHFLRKFSRFRSYQLLALVRRHADTIRQITKRVLAIEDCNNTSPPAIILVQVGPYERTPRCLSAANRWQARHKAGPRMAASWIRKNRLRDKENQDVYQYGYREADNMLCRIATTSRVSTQDLESSLAWSVRFDIQVLPSVVATPTTLDILVGGSSRLYASVSQSCEF
jgi:hypothetical protein